VRFKSVLRKLELHKHVRKLLVSVQQRVLRRWRQLQGYTKNLLLFFHVLGYIFSIAPFSMLKTVFAIFEINKWNVSLMSKHKIKVSLLF